MNTSLIKRSDRACFALTGQSRYAFELLVPEFAWNLEEVLRTRRPVQDRKRKYGAGHPRILDTVEKQLFAVLFFLKSYMTYDVLGFILGVDGSTAFRNICIYLVALEKTLKRKLVLPVRKISTPEEFFEKFPEAKEVFADAYERMTQKPVSLRRRKKLYSGKKKATTRKTMVITDTKKHILVLSPTNSGRRHDKRLADKYDMIRHLPHTLPLYVDTGFQGVQKVHPHCYIPIKSTKKHPLTSEQKEMNQLISSVRVVVEHAIAGIKRYKAARDIYRNRIPHLDDLFQLLSAGLWNYHLSMA